MAGRSLAAPGGAGGAVYDAAMPTVAELIDDAEQRLKASDAVDHPHSGKERSDAEEIMSFVLGHPDELDLDASIPSAAEQRFHALIDRRVAGEPPAYIVGSTEFSGLRIAVAPGAFIPRQSSEWMVDQAVRRLRRRREPVHVDLATGIGPVALAVARRVPNARVIGVDIADVPVRLPRADARELG